MVQHIKQGHTMSKRDLSSALTAYLSTFEAERPEAGFRTLADWGSIMGVGERQAFNVIERLMKAGKADSRKYRTVCRSVIRPRPHYRISPEALKALGLTKARR